MAQDAKTVSPRANALGDVNHTYSAPQGRVSRSAAPKATGVPRHADPMRPSIATSGHDLSAPTSPPGCLNTLRRGFNDHRAGKFTM